MTESVEEIENDILSDMDEPQVIDRSGMAAQRDPKPIAPALSDEPTHAAMVNLESFLKFVNGELERMEKLDGAMQTMEDIIFDTEQLRDLPIRQAQPLYEMLSGRRESTQRFLLKFMELGIKSNFLSRLMQAHEKDRTDVRKPSVTSQRTRLLVQRILDEKVTR
jgi:hypothetical protein